MKFAKIAFWIAAISGLLTITPLYFIFDQIGEKDPPPITHPAFFYGFVGVALVWQIAFVFIARDPIRFRPMMIPAILEKLVYSIPVIILVLQKRTRSADLRRHRPLTRNSLRDCLPPHSTRASRLTAVAAMIDPQRNICDLWQQEVGA